MDPLAHGQCRLMLHPRWEQDLLLKTTCFSRGGGGGGRREREKEKKNEEKNRKAKLKHQQPGQLE